MVFSKQWILNVESLSLALDKILFVEAKSIPKNASRAIHLAALLLVRLAPFVELHAMPCVGCWTRRDKDKLGYPGIVSEWLKCKGEPTGSHG